MARDKQVSENEKRVGSTQSTTTPSSSAGAPDATERERDIATGQEGRAERGRNLARPYSASLQQPSASPFALMRRMSEDMDRLLDHFGFGRLGLGLGPSRRTLLDDDVWNLTSPSQQDQWLPQVEVFERGDKLVVRADLPGLNKDDVDVEIDDGVLTISGERKDEHEESREGFYRSERSYGRFYRTISLPDGVDPDRTDASFKNGVLEISFDAPKQEETRKAKRIQVR